MTEAQKPCVRIPREHLPPGRVMSVLIGEQRVCVANADGEIYAVSDTCTHARVSLSGGTLEGRQIICPWHHAMFDLATGRATCGPAVDPLRCYSVRSEGEFVVIEPVESLFED